MSAAHTTLHEMLTTGESDVCGFLTKKKVQKSALARTLTSVHYRQWRIWLLSGYNLAGLHALTLAPCTACMNGRAKLLSPHGRIRPDYNRVVRRYQRWQQTPVVWLSGGCRPSRRVCLLRWWFEDNKVAGLAARTDLVSTFMFLTSLIGGLRILLFVADSWCSEESEQRPQALLLYGNVFLCHLFISLMWFLGAQLSSLGSQGSGWSAACDSSIPRLRLSLKVRHEWTSLPDGVVTILADGCYLTDDPEQLAFME